MVNDMNLTLFQPQCTVSKLSVALITNKMFWFWFCEGDILISVQYCIFGLRARNYRQLE